jgi:two-component system, OmpR family, osmolarity sensor histidine kinase EnvZ
VTQDVAALIDLRKVLPQERDNAVLRRIAQERLGLAVDFLPVNEMPPIGPKPFFSLLDQALSQEVRKQIGKPFWIDTVGRSNLVELRIQLDDAVMRVFARRSAAYASNSEIFLLWMVGTSLVLITVAILFLRNQIRPILRLADAVESFGKGRDVPNFRPRGAQEVRRAASAFIEMKSRVERTIEQRTTMLAGVSHDLRTVLTRFKLELALIGDGPEVEAMKKDIDEMSRMLEAYLAFARGDAGEQSEATDMALFLEELRADAERHGHQAIPSSPCAPTRSSAASPTSSPTPRDLPPPSRSPASATTAISPSPWTTTAPAFPPICARTCSSRSCGSTMPATRTKAAAGSGSPSRATSPAPMAATSCSATARWAACARPCGCRCRA